MKWQFGVPREYKSVSDKNKALIGNVFSNLYFAWT